jgi:hypothetical protein
MKLCNTKYFVNTGGGIRRLSLAVLSLALILALPVAGGRWAGLPASVWLDFPPQRVVVQHAPYVWGVWVGLALAILAVVLPVAWRVVRAGPLSCATGSRPGHAADGLGMPAWGWAGLGWMLVAWVVAWTRFPALAPIQRHTYVMVWTGYIVMVLALTQRRAGTCGLTRRPVALAGLAACSAVFWWGFEFLNRGVQNWFYQNVEGFSPFEYALMATLSFTTVLPAVLGTHDWLATMPRLTAGLEDWVRIRLARPRLAGAGFALAGAVGLFCLPVFPNVLFPLLWLAPLALLCGLRQAKLRCSMIWGAATGARSCASPWRR